MGLRKELEIIRYRADQRKTISLETVSDVICEYLSLPLTARKPMVVYRRFKSRTSLSQVAAILASYEVVQAEKLERAIASICLEGETNVGR